MGFCADPDSDRRRHTGQRPLTDLEGEVGIRGDVLPLSEPSNTRMIPAVAVEWLGAVVLEGGLHLTGAFGQRHQRLCTVHNLGIGGGELGVADAAAGSPQVDFTRPHDRVKPSRVAMLNFSSEQPAHDLQSDMRMPRHTHPADPLERGHE